MRVLEYNLVGLVYGEEGGAERLNMSQKGEGEEQEEICCVGLVRVLIICVHVIVGVGEAPSPHIGRRGARGEGGECNTVLYGIVHLQGEGSAIQIVGTVDCISPPSPLRHGEY